MPVETEESNVPQTPMPTPKKVGAPLQIGGVTAPAQGAPLKAAPPSGGQGPAPTSGPPPMQGGMFPGGPVPPPTGGVGAPTGPPAISPPSRASAQFLPPNFQSQLGQAGFFNGPGASPDAGLDPMEWLKSLFGGLAR